MSYQINYNGTKNHVTFQGALTRTAQLPNDLVFLQNNMLYVIYKVNYF